MRNISKVKTPSVGKAKHDSTWLWTNKETTAEQPFYFVNFVSWVDDWKNMLTQSLTRETTIIVVHQACINPLVTDPLYLACNYGKNSDLKKRSDNWKKFPMSVAPVSR